MKVILKNSSLIFKTFSEGVEGVTFGSSAPAQTLKSALVDASVEVLDESFDKTILPMALTFTNPTSGYHVAQLGLFDESAYDGTTLFTWSVQQDSSLTGIMQITLNPWRDALDNKVKIHLTIDWSKIPPTLYFRAENLSDVSLGVSFNLSEMKRYSA